MKNATNAGRGCLAQFGYVLIVIGVLAFILPIFGYQNKLIISMSEMFGGSFVIPAIVVIVVGGILLLFSRAGLKRE